MSIGENIKRFRKSKGLSQIELAKKCNIIYQTLSKYERGLLNPKIDTLKKIANALGVSVNQLMFNEHTIEQLNDSENSSILNKAIKTYGVDAQLDMCIEEMSELTKEICKHKRGKNNHNEIVEEMADVHIMLEQLEIMMNIDPEEIDSIKSLKLDRLNERLKQHEQ